MKLILRFAIRNLIRQKRRNILLGIAIAFGMMILVVANSFSHGFSDTLINRLIVLMTGHMDIMFVEEGKFRAPFMRERQRFEKIIRDNVVGIKNINENLQVMIRAVGKGKSDNGIIIGIAPKDMSEFMDQNKALTGNIQDLMNNNIVNPVVISKSKADFLNVDLHDTLRVRLQNVQGQQQTGILTVVAITKSANLFLDWAFFVNNQNTKKLMGLRPHETGTLQVILEDPDTSVEQANKIHKLLNPDIAFIPGTTSFKNREIETVSLAFFRNKQPLQTLKENIEIKKDDKDRSFTARGVIISEYLASKLKIDIGQKITTTYKNRYQNKITKKSFTVTGIYKAKKNSLSRNTILLSDKLFYKTYYSNLPLVTKEQTNDIKEKIAPQLISSIGSEWKLLKRSPDFNELKKKVKDFMTEKNYVAAIDVRTMHETGSNIIKMERVLNLITFIAVLVLFFIILIGVINTLRMTIKERTREIGTIRAIGMQAKDVRNLIITETLLLAFCACLIGIVAAFIVMGLSHFWIIEASSFMNILLVEHRLHFVPSPISIIFNFILILFIAVATSFFPARKAANEIVANALRHHE